MTLPMNVADIGSVISSLPGSLGIATGAEANNIIHVGPSFRRLGCRESIVIARNKAIAGTPPTIALLLPDVANSSSRRPTATFS